MAVVRVALIQLAIDDAEPPPLRLRRVLGIIESLRDRADLVVLPELWPTGAFATQAALQAAEPLDGPTFQALGAAAAGAGLHVLAGSLPESGAKPFNTAVVFGPDGARRAVYRKIHLFGFDGAEAASFSAGEPNPVVWQSPWGTFGLATCYDLRFPELFRALVDEGAEAFLVPTGWPTKRILHWDVLAQARAVENQAWLIGVNAVGTHANTAMGGHSVVIDPRGEVVYRAGDAEDVAVIEIDVARAAAWRETFPALRDRRL